METQPYGLKKPQSGDKGQAIFDALSGNIVQIDGHSHNGVDSPKLSISSTEKLTQYITSGSWSNPVNGIYEATVSMTGGLQFDDTTISLRDTDSGESLNLKLVKVTPSSFRVHCNDATKNVTVVYA